MTNRPNPVDQQTYAAKTQQIIQQRWKDKQGVGQAAAEHLRRWRQRAIRKSRMSSRTRGYHDAGESEMQYWASQPEVLFDTVAKVEGWPSGKRSSSVSTTQGSADRNDESGTRVLCSRKQLHGPKHAAIKEVSRGYEQNRCRNKEAGRGHEQCHCGDQKGTTCTEEETERQDLSPFGKVVTMSKELSTHVC